MEQEFSQLEPSAPFSGLSLLLEACDTLTARGHHCTIKSEVEPIQYPWSRVCLKKLETTLELCITHHGVEPDE